MPLWVFYAVLGAAVNTVANFVDKLVLERHVKDYRGLVIFSAIVGFVVGTIIWASTGFQLLSLTNSLIALAVGVLSIIATAIYFKALQDTSTSTVILIFQFIPFLVLAMAAVFLKESLTLQSILGFLLILFPAIAISWEGGSIKDFKVNKSLVLVLIVDVLWAVASILMKYVTETQTFSSLISYESWGWGLGGLILVILFPTIRQAFATNVRKVSKLGLTIIVINEFIYVMSKLLGFLAISLGPVYLVSVLGSTQVFFAVIFGLVLGLIAPKIFKEDNTKQGLIKKAVCSVLIFAGVVLVS
ncbi:MAG: EamA family transporter [candidate division WWE3 bacterium]|nr:EamA family transporter [candidate division WWE3 bacterium]